MNFYICISKRELERFYNVGQLKVLKSRICLLPDFPSVEEVENLFSSTADEYSIDITNNHIIVKITRSFEVDTSKKSVQFLSIEHIDELILLRERDRWVFASEQSSIDQSKISTVSFEIFWRKWRDEQQSKLLLDNTIFFIKNLSIQSLALVPKLQFIKKIIGTDAESKHKTFVGDLKSIYKIISHIPNEFIEDFGSKSFFLSSNYQWIQSLGLIVSDDVHEKLESFYEKLHICNSNLELFDDEEIYILSNFLKMIFPEAYQYGICPYSVAFWINYSYLIKNRRLSLEYFLKDLQRVSKKINSWQFAILILLMVSQISENLMYQIKLDIEKKII